AGPTFGRFAAIDLKFDPKEAEETSPEVPCGSGFSIFETTTKLLAESLEALQEPWWELHESQLQDINSKDVPTNNGEGATGTRDGTWEIRIQPSLGWAYIFKSIFQALAETAGAEGDVVGAVTAAC